VRNQEWDPALAELNTLDLAELELSLLSLDAVDGEAALGVVDETEVLAGLLEGDDIHEASGEGAVSADLAVNLDETLHQDGLDLTTVQGVLETVADEDDQGKAVAQLVGTGGGLGRIGSGHLVQEPVRGRAKALLVLSAVKPLQLVMVFQCRIFFLITLAATGCLNSLCGRSTKPVCKSNDRDDNYLTLTGHAF
jgi:hypothetical protein